jgi:hypothetical protein
VAPDDVGRRAAGFGPSLVLARLYEKTSAAGRQYFIGRIGEAKIAILRSREVSESGDPVWDVLLSQAAAPQLTPAEPAVRAPSRTPPRRLRKPSSRNDGRRDLPYDGLADLWSEDQP